MKLGELNFLRHGNVDSSAKVGILANSGTLRPSQVDFQDDDYR